jgi:hypothetical protein
LDGENTVDPVLDSDQTSEEDRNGFTQERTVKIGEFGAVDSENRVRSSLGLGIRKSYDGFSMSNRTYSSGNRRIDIPGVGTYTGRVTVAKNGTSYASFSGKTAQAVFSKLLANIKAGKPVNVSDYKPKSGSKKVRFNRDDQATSYDD